MCLVLGDAIVDGALHVFCCAPIFFSFEPFMSRATFTTHFNKLFVALFMVKIFQCFLVQKVDLSKLETTALWRYWRHFNLVSTSIIMIY